MVNQAAQKLFPTEPLLNITLASSHEIEARSLHLSHAYEGQLVGLPCAHTNQRQLERLPRTLQKILGDCPVYIVPPEIEHVEAPPEYPDDPELKPMFLPPLRMAARSECTEALDPEKDGSQLIVTWYQHSCPPLMSPAIQAEVERIRWHEHAKDFEF